MSEFNDKMIAIAKLDRKWREDDHRNIKGEPMNENVKTAYTRPVEIEFMEYEEPRDLFSIAQWIGAIKSVEVDRQDVMYFAEIEYCRNGVADDVHSLTMQAGDLVIKDLDGFYRVYDRNGFKKYFELKED